MSAEIPIIETKFVPPVVKDAYIRRPELMKKMRAFTNYKLAIVHSGAGYGKSTAISQFLQDENIDYCWYSITSNDDGLVPFVTNILYSIRRQVPEFGKELEDVLTSTGQYIKEEDLYKLSAVFTNECMKIPHTLSIILDDYHLIDHSFLINQWMEKVIEYLPDHIHFFLSTRTRPSWSSFVQLKISRHLLEVTESDLSLSDEEVELLLTDFYERPIPGDQIKSICDLTEGWVIAVSMIHSQIQENQGIVVVDKQYSSLTELFHYLAHEVYSKQSPVVQQFLKQISILQEIDGETCEAIFEVPGSSQMLKQLSEKNALLQEMKGGMVFRLHALFQTFLERKLLEENAHLFNGLQQKCAYHFERKGQWEKAVFHYFKMGNLEAVASILTREAEGMIKRGHLEMLGEYLLKLPESIKNHYHSLWVYQGEFFRYRSFYEKAEKAYLQGIQHASEKQDAHIGSRAYVGIGRIYLDTIQPGKAQRYLLKAIECLEEVEGDFEQEKHQLYHLISENLVNSGKAIQARIWYEKGKGNGNTMEEGNLGARMFLRTGKLKEAKELLLGNNQDEQLPQSHREKELLLSLIESFMGNGSEAKVLAQQGIGQGIKSKSPFVEACGWMRMGHAVQLIPGYNRDLAKECYETSLSLMGKINVSRGKAEPYMGLSILYSRMGDYERAKKYADEALHETEKVEDLWLSSLIMLSAGINDYYRGEYSLAFNQFTKALRQFDACGDGYGKMLTSLWKSAIAFACGKDDEFREYMTTCINEVQIANYEFVFFRPTTFGPKDLQSFIPMLVKAHQEGIQASYCLGLLRKLGYESLSSHPGYTLRIHTLGRFEIWLGDERVQDKRWQREKAKELFQYLLINRHHIKRKEEIIEELWPEGDGSDRDFKVALNTLNNVLEPNRPARGKPFFISRMQEGYKLNELAGIEYDSDEFSNWVLQGLKEHDVDKSIQFLERGLLHYKGSFLTDRKGTWWTEKERERLQHLYVRGLEKRAQLAIRKESYDEAIDCSLSIIEQDPLWEEAYRILMFCYYQKNNRPQAVKWFQRCKELLDMELGVAPMKATQEMYDMVIGVKG
ncbi:transcriptional regulator [Rossellomorea aquimaris]|uniref:BTAD domain-containing putative transcriptional regulator n=1 Tax=Rossellomorea aquimaris TaxID=189382 RepID=UPI001CD69261|nr:BTAD domain-containing putative transcriptional regulator [Rossellomorea aquimaris]MCA1056433.1 transcriptional regulator [Rossellomorea aquimaris]